MAETSAPGKNERQEPNTNEGSVRETLESIIIAFVLAFMFRAFIVEAFVIPTGSMAPTLLGAHFRAECPMCGYQFTLNAADQSRTSADVDCTMCDYEISLGAKPTLQESGDRILVLKYVYEFAEPQRWQVVVFKNPKDPEQNYIKRLVGLPEEELWLVGGNVFTRPLNADGTATGNADAWRIQRKPYEVQQAVWVPVYHSRYYPLDDGDPSVSGPIETYSPRSRAWHVPWQPTERTEQAWSFEQRGPHWRHEGDEAGVLAFEFADKHLLNYYNYNALRNGPAPLSDDPIEDMRVGATFVPEDTGLTVTMRTGSQRRQFRGTLDAEGNAKLEMRPVVMDPQEDAGPWETVAQVEGRPLEAGQGTRVELWHADQRLSMWRDGDLLAEWTYEEEASALAERSFEIIQPAVDITVAGPAVTLHKVNLDRDLYHTSAEKMGALGTSDPITIAADNFYCLGDNSPASEDSRLWDAVDPWLLNMTDVPVGFVPREMMIGRAFYVYFPAMWRFREGGAAVIPNFADMRFIR